MHNIKQLLLDIPEFNNLKDKPKSLYFCGNKELLFKRKVSIVGSRKPNSYTKKMTHIIASELSKRDVVVVSGGAMGVDGIAHKAANNNTIAIMPGSLDIIYPKANFELIKNIYKNALAISEFEKEYRPFAFSFVKRNRLVVALGEILIVTQAEIDSGSFRSIEIALKLGKKIFVLPHRIGESDGTNILIKDKKVQTIYDIEEFLNSFGKITKRDEFMEFCSTNPTYDEAFAKFGDKIFEAELEGKIEVKNGRIFV